MTNIPVLNRVQLAQLFNNNQQAIIAFEQVLSFVSNADPLAIGTLTEQLTLIQSEIISINATLTVISTMQANILTLTNEVNDLMNRIDNKRRP